MDGYYLGFVIFEGTCIRLFNSVYWFNLVKIFNLNAKIGLGILAGMLLFIFGALTCIRIAIFIIKVECYLIFRLRSCLIIPLIRIKIT